MGTNLETWYTVYVKDKVLNDLSQDLLNKLERGKGGRSLIELPEEIKLNLACINIHNSDKLCFLWSILGALHPVNKNAERSSKYPHPYDGF